MEPMGDAPNPLVLVVEDYQDAREMYAAYLQFSGFRVAEAANGLEALEKTRELLPDIILMDLALPKMDGWEATRRLEGRRADPPHSHRRIDRTRARRTRRGRAPGGLRRVCDQALSARRAGGRNPANACGQALQAECLTGSARVSGRNTPS